MTDVYVFLIIACIIAGLIYYIVNRNPIRLSNKEYENKIVQEDTELTKSVYINESVKTEPFKEKFKNHFYVVTDLDNQFEIDTKTSRIESIPGQKAYIYEKTENELEAERVAIAKAKLENERIEAENEMLKAKTDKVYRKTKFYKILDRAKAEAIRNNSDYDKMKFEKLAKYFSDEKFATFSTQTQIALINAFSGYSNKSDFDDFYNSVMSEINADIKRENLKTEQMKNEQERRNQNRGL